MIIIPQWNERRATAAFLFSLCRQQLREKVANNGDTAARQSRTNSKHNQQPRYHPFKTYSLAFG
jgi:hypothetical protein